MTPEQAAMAEEIALFALGMDRADREAYVCRRTAHEPEVRAEVRRRLELGSEIPNGFLDRPAVQSLGSEETTSARRQAELPAVTELGELPFAEGRRYRLLEVLGRGGMGVVFRAHDRRLDRQVAIKHLQHPPPSDPRALRRFRDEARAAARISHPAIVQVFDVLHDRDDLWIVMELVPGRSLASHLAEGPIKLTDALALAADIADGLAAAHARGIVHRDLKAANVMVVPPGRVKILDFGLATLTAADDEGRGAGEALLGTPTAMSPEQLIGAPVDVRSDLFSLGVLLYRMVTGVSPFAASSLLVTLDRVRRLRPPPARRLVPDLPEEVSALIDALLEKEPERRPRDASEVARALRRAADRAAGLAARWHRRARPPANATREVFPSAGAERRPVTLVSCQLVAAGRLGALLDPEELLALEEPFRDLALPVLARFDGHPEGWLDGGFRACFGFPRAREDDPQRAVAAALELAGMVERWRADGGPADPRLRVVVHTGPIVVVAAPGGERQIVVGRTGCCATELRTAEVELPPEPGAVLISEATRELVRDRFRCEPLGICSLGLCQAPLEAFLVRPATGEGAGVAEGAAPTPLVGRRAELALLRRRWREAAAGHGHAVVVSGEAGSGKTRLLRALRELPAIATASWLELSCRPADVALAGQLTAALGTADAAAPEPERLARHLAELAAHGTTVLAIEDVHRADADDLELLGLLIERAPSSRLLLLLTCRPPFVPPWKTALHLTACSLGPLGEPEARRMIRHLAAGRTLDPAAADEILAAADGVPRFIEALTRMFLGSQTAANWHATAAAASAGPRPPIAIPATLGSWLTARLDRLGEAREVARAASVLGRELTFDQLSALLPAAGDALLRGLEQLTEAEILQRRSGRAGAVYRFRYALDRAAAYQSLLGEHRELYRRRAARAVVPPPCGGN